jgi:dienelactone hydrolase
MYRRWVSLMVAAALMLVLGLAPAAMAQDDDALDLVPVELDAFGIRSVVPAAWAEQPGGRFPRGAPPADLAQIVMQAAPISIDLLWPNLLPSLGLDEAPESTGTLSTDHFDWALYALPVEVAGLSLEVEIALAEADGTVYLVILQSAPDEFAALREAVLVPALEALALQVEAPPAAGFTAEEVSFAGGAPEVELAGTLTLPSGLGPHPAIVLMSGSGGQDRDSALPGVTALKPFELIAEALTEAGVAVLRYDDRGIGRSIGVHAEGTIDDFAGDAAAAIDFLESRDDVDPERIGILGHSEGGIYASILGASDPRVAFIVSLAGPAIPGVELLVEQNEAVVRASGQPEEEVAAVRAFAEIVMPQALTGNAEAVEATLRDFFGATWDRQGEDVRTQLGERDAYVQASVDAQLPALLSDSYRALLAYDPEPDWSRVTAPVLGIYGGLDVQVPSVSNEPALRMALEAAGNEDWEMIVLPDANHLFQAAVTGAVGEYSELAPEFTADLLPSLVRWVVEHTSVR